MKLEIVVAILWCTVVGTFIWLVMVESRLRSIRGRVRNFLNT